MTMEQNLCAAEAIIFASGDGISTQKLKEVLELDLKQLQYILETLSEKYNRSESGIRFVKNTEAVFFTTDTEYADYVHRCCPIWTPPSTWWSPIPTSMWSF